MVEQAPSGTCYDARPGLLDQRNLTLRSFCDGAFGQTHLLATFNLLALALLELPPLLLRSTALPSYFCDRPLILQSCRRYQLFKPVSARPLDVESLFDTICNSYAPSSSLNFSSVSLHQSFVIWIRKLEEGVGCQLGTIPHHSFVIDPPTATLPCHVEDVDCFIFGSSVAVVCMHAPVHLLLVCLSFGRQLIRFLGQATLLALANPPTASLSTYLQTTPFEIVPRLLLA